MKKRKPRTKDDKWYQALTEEYDKVKITCSCGHRVIVPMRTDKVVCAWCGHYVYRDKQLEFKERLLGQMKRRK